VPGGRIVGGRSKEEKVGAAWLPTSVVVRRQVSPPPDSAPRPVAFRHTLGRGGAPRRFGGRESRPRFATYVVGAHHVRAGCRCCFFGKAARTDVEKGSTTIRWNWSEMPDPGRVARMGSENHRRGARPPRPRRRRSPRPTHVSGRDGPGPRPRGLELTVRKPHGGTGWGGTAPLSTADPSQLPSATWPVQVAVAALDQPLSTCR